MRLGINGRVMNELRSGSGDYIRVVKSSGIRKLIGWRDDRVPLMIRAGDPPSLVGNGGCPNGGCDEARRKGEGTRGRRNRRQRWDGGRVRRWTMGFVWDEDSAIVSEMECGNWVTGRYNNWNRTDIGELERDL